MQLKEVFLSPLHIGHGPLDTVYATTSAHDVLKQVVLPCTVARLRRLSDQYSSFVVLSPRSLVRSVLALSSPRISLRTSQDTLGAVVGPKLWLESDKCACSTVQPPT